MKNGKPGSCLIVVLMLFFSNVSYSQVDDPSAPMVDAEIWLDAQNVYWAELKIIAQSNIWGPDRTHVPSPNIYEYASVSAAPYFMNFDPLGGCNVGGCFSYANYKIVISWKITSNSFVRSRHVYIDYMNADINEDYFYEGLGCAIDIVFYLDGDEELPLEMDYKGGFPSCRHIAINPYNGQSFNIWDLNGASGPNIANSFKIPTSITTSCGSNTCDPNRIFKINGSSPQQDPCPSSGCLTNINSETNFTAEAYSVFENYDQYGDMFFYYWRLPDGTNLHGVNPLSSVITRSQYAYNTLPLVYEANYDYDWNPPSSPAEDQSKLLATSYPNPFNPATTISYMIPKASHVSLVVYDLLGRSVARLVDGWHEAAQYEASWDASAMPSGLYLYRLEIEGQVLTGKLQLLK